MKVITDLKNRLVNSLPYLTNAINATRSSKVKSDLYHVEMQINKVLDVLKKSKVMDKVICSQCLTYHIPYAHREHNYDIDEKDKLSEEIKQYPSTVTENEILINYPWCRKCYLEESGDPPSWDEEYLNTLYLLENDPN